MATEHAPRAARRLRVLAVVELGGNWGHLLRLRPIIAALRARGHVAVLATSDVRAARRMFGNDADIEFVEWPTLQGRFRVPAGTRFQHYAQVLERCAFGDAAGLRLGVQRWTSTLRRLKPDVMLVDFAPAALFAAHLLRVPVVQAVMGWEAPPSGQPLPSIRPWHDVDLAPYARIEAALLHNLNAECVRAGVAPLACVSDLYGVGTQLLATWPEIDHFGPRRGARYIGPIYTEDMGTEVDWPADSGRPRVLTYLAGDPRSEAVIAELGTLGAEVIAVVPDLPADVAERLRGPHVRVYDKPICIGRVVAGARLAITNGGHGLIGACVRSGVPMLLLPRFAEQAVLARRMQQSGLARSLLSPSGDGQPDLALLAAALTDDAAARTSAQAALRYAATPPAASVLAVADAVECAGNSDLRDAAVDGELGAVDEGRLVAGQEQRGVGDVLAARDAT